MVHPDINDGVVFGKPKNAEAFKEQAIKLYGPDATLFLQLYPANTNEEAASAQADITRDQIFGIQNYTWANIQAVKGKYNTYLYRFTRRLPATGEYVKFGAFHTGEVAYAYDNLSFVHRCAWEPADYYLAAIMSSFWANFASTGNPNGKGLPEWPAYNTKSYPTMMLGAEIQSETLPGRAGLDFLIAHLK